MSQSELIQAFNQLFSSKPSYIARAPGRVNIIGEHTDYNDGFVLPCALHYKTQIVASRRDDSIIKAISLQYPEQVEEFDLAQPIHNGNWAWGDYLRGVAKELLDAGHELSGMNLLVTSDVPQGSGLSSSAALEVAIGGLFNHVFALGLAPQDIARTGQLAENNFIDCQCGIMDQLISAKAQFHTALLIDCMDLSTKPVALPDNLALLVINSNYPRKLAESAYNERRLSCEQAAAIMRVPTLRQADLKMLDAAKSDMSDVVYRRAKHVVSENQRVLQAAEALQQSDLSTLYSVMHDAHLSLKHDFEITVPPTDGLVDIVMNALDNRGACRQTGGGFGGAVICLCDKKDIDKVVDAVSREYPEKFGLKADVLECEPHQGLTVEDI